jgi:hypothetical protein
VGDFIELILEFFFQGCLMAKHTFIVLRQSVRVAVEEAALALHAQQTRLLITVEAFLPVFLFHTLFISLFLQTQPCELCAQLTVLHRDRSFGIGLLLLFGRDILVAFGAVASEGSFSEECLATFAFLTLLWTFCLRHLKFDGNIWVL